VFSDHVSFRAKLEVKTALHVGSGQSKSDKSDLQETSSQADSDAANSDHEKRLFFTVVQGLNGPVIPGSTLKGALRADLKAAGEGDLARTIFGEISDHKSGVGRTALLWLDNAHFADFIGDAPEGLSEHQFAQTGPGLFRAKHNAIDRQTGSVAPNKLYDREVVAPGVRLSIAGEWFGGNSDDWLKALAILVRGLPIGKDRSKGAGQIVLQADTLKLTRHTNGSDGKRLTEAVDETELTEINAKIAKIASELREPESAHRILRATCSGPFISMRGTLTDEASGRKTVKPLEADGKPVLWTKSVAGALRNRAAWIEQIKLINETDNLDAPSVDDMEKTFSTSSDTVTLSPVERLFGVTGYRARLNIKSVTPTPESVQRQNLTSVSIDRVTGAGRDKFLFTEQVFWNVAFDIDLSLAEDADDEVHEVFERLLADLKTNGIELGHGAAKGFGLFDEVKEIRP